MYAIRTIRVYTSYVELCRRMVRPCIWYAANIYKSPLCAQSNQVKWLHITKLLHTEQSGETTIAQALAGGHAYGDAKTRVKPNRTDLMHVCHHTPSRYNLVKTWPRHGRQGSGNAERYSVSKYESKCPIIKVPSPQAVHMHRDTREGMLPGLRRPAARTPPLWRRCQRTGLCAAAAGL